VGRWVGCSLGLGPYPGGPRGPDPLEIKICVRKKFRLTPFERFDPLGKKQVGFVTPS